MSKTKQKGEQCKYSQPIPLGLPGADSYRHRSKRTSSVNPAMCGKTSKRSQHRGGVGTVSKNIGQRESPLVISDCFHSLDRLPWPWYTCSSALHNSILFAGSKGKPFPWIKAVACLPLCRRGAACTTLSPFRATGASLHPPLRREAFPNSGSNHLCDQHGIEAVSSAACTGTVCPVDSAVGGF